jgi:hypothetical protein
LRATPDPLSVPANHCQGQLRFTVIAFDDIPVVTEVAAEAGAVSAAGAGHARDSTVVYGRFEPAPTFRVHGVLVHYTGDGMDLPAPTGLDLAATLEYVLRTYPIGRIEFDDCTEIELDKNLRTPGGGCGPGFEGPGGPGRSGGRRGVRAARRPRRGAALPALPVARRARRSRRPARRLPRGAALVR